MKLLTKIAAISALTLSVFGIANAQPVLEPTDNYVTSKLCIAAAQGKKIKLASDMKEFHLTKDYVIEEVKCNGLSFTTFVEQYGSQVNEINDYLTRGKYSEEKKDSA
jgi:hypothetical protein